MNPTQYWPWPPMLKRPHAERERDRDRGEHQRRRDPQRLLQVLRGPHALVAGHPREEPVEARPVEDRPVGRDRVVPGDEDDEAADQEGEDGRRERNERTAQAVVEEVGEPGKPGLVRLGLGGLAHAACSLAPPVIAMPSSSSETSGPYSPTMRPS